MAFDIPAVLSWEVLLLLTWGHPRMGWIAQDGLAPEAVAKSNFGLGDPVLCMASVRTARTSYTTAVPEGWS